MVPGPLPMLTVRSFRVRAWNASGRSFPTEVLTAGTDHTRTAQLLLEKPLKTPPFPYFSHQVRGPEVMYHVVMRDDVQQKESLPNHRALITENRLPEPGGYSAARRLYARLRGLESSTRLSDDLADLLSDLDSAASTAWSRWQGQAPADFISLLTLDSYLETVPNPESRVVRSAASVISSRASCPGIRRGLVVSQYPLYPGQDYIGGFSKTVIHDLPLCRQQKACLSKSHKQASRLIIPVANSQAHTLWVG